MNTMTMTFFKPVPAFFVKLTKPDSVDSGLEPARKVQLFIFWDRTVLYHASTQCKTAKKIVVSDPRKSSQKSLTFWPEANSPFAKVSLILGGPVLPPLFSFPKLLNKVIFLLLFTPKSCELFTLVFLWFSGDLLGVL